MCGNFNGNKKDDKILPSGMLAPSDADFGNAWQVNASLPGCRKDFVGSGTCPHKHRVNQHCAVLSNRSGPFAECHWHEKPEPYVQSCRYDLCQYGMGNRMLCAALEAYAELCALHGVKLSDWRAVLGCNIACPPNSYYDFCGNPCQFSCATLNSNITCSHPCISGCFCQKGYALENGTCIPQDHCGCVLNGQYYPLGAEVFLTDTCSQKCKCLGPGRAMECQPHACGPREVCRLRDGVRGCYPIKYGTMWLYGDPHLRTFDGAIFSFRGACRVALVQTCDTHLTPFAIWLKVEHQNSTGASWAKQVDVDIDGERFSLLAGQHKTIQVNGATFNLLLSLNMGDINLYQDGFHLSLQTAFGLVFTSDLVHSLFLSLPPHFMGHTCGLCGNYNGDPRDDFPPQRASPVGDPVASSASQWKPDGDCKNNCANGCPTCMAWEQLVPAKAQDWILQDPWRPFSFCHMEIDLEPFASACANDLRLSMGNSYALCLAIQTYAAACPRVNVTSGNWRSSSFCALRCPPHNYYQVYACPHHCSYPVSKLKCGLLCADDCVCDDGQQPQGSSCLPHPEPNCAHQGAEP